MDVSGGRRRGLTLVVLVVLLAAVAIGSTGRAPVGSGVARRPSEQLVDAIASIALVVIGVGAAAVLYVMVSQRRAIAEQRARLRERRNPLARLVVLAVLLGLVAVVVRREQEHQLWPFSRGGQSQSTPAPGSAAGDGRAGGSSHYEPHFATVPVVVVLGAAGAGLLALALAGRARRRHRARASTDGTVVLQLADVLAETLDDLRAEPDPRVAVVAAYARLELTLGAFGLPRSPAEAPDEYLRRLLVDLEVGSRPATRLTELFTRAKFSTHQIDHHAKDEAISLLDSIRADLLASTQAHREPALGTGSTGAWGRAG